MFTNIWQEKIYHWDIFSVTKGNHIEPMRKSPLRMMRGERLWVAVGDRGQPHDKSLRRNLSATPQRGSTKGFLSLEEERGDETGLNSDLEIGEDWKSGLSSRSCTCTGA
ncbi:hypothetical protein AVEN_115436-1 [Araneus ventricosus]|uniref:Uncharacterized protein n=1 Tax=Araneus ventricosus TaxID=182803 RepID=A0A4Y2LF50_ARAVE|nr:hypothetical protein AVEN_115436-1 [Araneus ventricosus]